MNIDIIIVIVFFVVLLVTGFLPGKKSDKSETNYLLADRGIGLWTFIMTNVATWYGGILGVGEFTYRYGIVNWITQGLPYYLFAIIFAVFFVKKIRIDDALTIPRRIENKYGKNIALFSAVLVFILTSPAPYLLMTAIIFSHLFNISIFWSSVFVSIGVGGFLWYGGYKSDISTDIFQFFVMFIGFFAILFVLVPKYGGMEFLYAHLPPSHFSITGGNSKLYILVWWLIALWTFADPGFYQRTQAAKSIPVARKGIIISVAFWLIFDFLTNSVGLYARAVFPNLVNPSESFLVLADNALGAGVRGLFYAAMFATIISTLNSFLFISATTFSYDIIGRIGKPFKKVQIRGLIGIGIIVSSIISILISTAIPSVIDIWYTLGSLALPGLFFPLLGSYFSKISLSQRMTLLQIIAATLSGIVWYALRSFGIIPGSLAEIEPMLAGLAAGSVFYINLVLR